MLRFGKLASSFAIVIFVVIVIAGAGSALGAPDAPEERPAAPAEKKGEPAFSVVVVGLLGQFGQPSFIRGNRNGTAIGTLSSKVGDEVRNEPFICLRGGEPTPLAAPDGLGPNVRASVLDLNDNDWAVGSASPSARPGAGARPAFDTTVVVWIPGKGATDIGRLPGHRGAMPTRINNRNQVVGHSSGDRGRHGFLWEDGKGMRDLGDLPNGRGHVTASAVNELGHVAGGAGIAVPPGRREASHPFLWTPENGMKDLGELPGGAEEGTAFAVNDRDEVVGYCMTAAGHRAFRWTKDGMVELGSLPGWPTSIAYGINDAGWVVGTCRGPDFGGRGDTGRGFLWTADAGLRSLNDLLDPDGGRGWEITGAARVNALGEIDATGKKDGASYRVRLIPKVPLPPARPGV